MDDFRLFFWVDGFLNFIRVNDSS